MNQSNDTAAVRLAAVRLGRSDRGRDALRNIRAMLRDGIQSLDSGNQRAVVALLTAAWGGFPAATMDAINAQIGADDAND